jgi:hypothetical protein
VPGIDILFGNPAVRICDLLERRAEARVSFVLSILVVPLLVSVASHRHSSMHHPLSGLRRLSCRCRDSSNAGHTWPHQQCPVAAPGRSLQAAIACNSSSSSCCARTGVEWAPVLRNATTSPAWYLTDSLLTPFLSAASPTPSTATCNPYAVQPVTPLSYCELVQSRGRSDRRHHVGTRGFSLQAASGRRVAPVASWIKVDKGCLMWYNKA